MSKNLHSINNSGFYSNFMNLIEQYHLSNLDPESLDNQIELGDIQLIWKRNIYPSGDTALNIQRN